MQTIKNMFQSLKIKNKKELADILIRGLFLFTTILSASFIVIIIIFVAEEGIKPFISNNDGLGRVNFLQFITGTTWLKGTAFQSNLYSVGFIIVNTLYISFLALLLSMPIGVLTALFIAKIAPKKISAILRTVVELLASIPSIVYGLFGSGVILVFVYNLANLFGIQSKGGNSVLATVLVLSIMILPTITALSEVAIRSVGKEIEHGSLALGATKTQTNFKVVLTSAKSGIFSAAILGIGRALGEATAVSLVAGNARSGPTLDFFETTATLTSTMLQGLKETTGLDYDIRFSVGIILMVVILITNALLNLAKRKIGNVNVK
ncbi:MAG: phosphate ABC transporter permease subunit PstC [Candidatus Izimaplasma sp.]|nr:phosphate ABC transporter permease subunit PstC [Candidatus Izimaplasma bacterium]